MTKEQKLKLLGGIVAPAQDDLPEETIEEAIRAEELCYKLHGTSRKNLAKQVEMLTKAHEGIIRVAFKDDREKTTDF